MRQVVMYEPGDVRVEDRPDPTIIEPTDAIIRLAATCICGSDLWEYRGAEPVDHQVMGHEYVGVVEEVGSKVRVGWSHDVAIPGDELLMAGVHIHGGPAPVRWFLPELIQLIWDRTIDPGKVFDLTLPLDRAAEGYEAMDQRIATKVLLTL